MAAYSRLWYLPFRWGLELGTPESFSSYILYLGEFVKGFFKADNSFKDNNMMQKSSFSNSLRIFLLFISAIALISTVSAQSVQVEGLDVENVDVQYDGNNQAFNFNTSYMNQSLTPQQIYVPDELDNTISDFSWDVSSWEDGGVSSYTIQYKTIWQDDSYENVSQDVRRVIGDDSNADSDLPSNQFISSDSSYETEENGEIGTVFNNNIVDGESGYNVTWDVQVESHYEHLIINYELVYSNSSTTEVVHEWQDVYSGNDTERLPVSANILKYERDGEYQDRVRIENDRLYEYESKDVQVVVLSDKGQEFRGVDTINNKNIEEISSSGMYSKVENEAKRLKMDSVLVDDISDYQVHAYNMTLESDSRNIVKAFQKSPKGVNGNMSIYILGSFAGGSGTSSDPYQIETCQQLQDMNTDLSASYELIGDVDCSDFSGFSSVGDSGTPFSGVLDGRGYVVESLTIDEGSSNYVGLIGFLDNDGVVKNIGVVNVDVSGDYNVGGVVGQNGETSTALKDSYSTGNVSGNGDVGGVVGDNQADADRCYSTATITSGGDAGGFAGSNGAKIYQSYSKDAFVGYNYYGTVYDGYWDTESSSLSSSAGGTGLTTSEMQGQEASTNMEGFNFTNNWEVVNSEDDDASADGYPILQDLDRKNQLQAQNIYVSNHPPDAPSNPSPSDTATGVDDSTTLSVDVSDPDGDSMDVSFYDASDDSQIGSTQTGVSDGGTASVTWSNLNWGTSYSWYAVADDGSATTQSSTWSFTTNYAPDPGFTSSSPVLTQNDLGLDASGSTDQDGDTLSYTWDTDQDGTFELSGVTPSHSYGDDGTYDITLKADDGLTTSTTTKTVTVENRDPTADFTSTKDDKTLSVDGTGSTDQDGSISSYEWDWTDDGTFESTGSTSSHTYSSGGDYNVELKATDDDGATDTIVKTVSINKDPELNNFSIDNTEPGYGDNVTATADVTDPDGDSISDVKFSATKNGSTVYSDKSGSYEGSDKWEAPSVEADCADCDITISVESATDSNGGTSSFSSTDTVTVQNTPPSISSQRFNDSSPDYGDNVVFKADVSDKEYGVQDVKMTVWEAGSKILDNVSASTGSGDTFNSPEFSIDEADTEYTATVSYASDSSGESTNASAQGLTDPSISTNNTAPTIQNMSFNDSSPEFGDYVSFKAEVFDQEYGLNTSSLEFTVFKDGSEILVDNPDNITGDFFETDSFRVKDSSASYTGAVTFAEDTEGFSTSSDSQGLDKPDFSVDPLNVSDSTDVNVVDTDTDARDTVILDNGNLSADVTYLVENNLSIDADVDVQSKVASECSIDSGTTGTVPAQSHDNISVVVECPIGSTENDFLDVESNEPTSSFDTVEYTTEATVKSSYFEEDSINWDINESDLRKWGDREIGSPELYVNGSSVNTSVKYLSGQDKIRGVIESPSLDSGTYKLELTYYYPQETDSSDGGGGGGSVIVDDEEEEEDPDKLIHIEDVARGLNQPRGLIKHEVDFGKVVEKEFKAVNVHTELNQLRLEVPDPSKESVNDFCRYVEVEKEIGSSIYGDRGVYSIPPSGETNERFPKVRYKVPEKDLLESQGITDFSCSLKTASTYGEPDPVLLEVKDKTNILKDLRVGKIDLWGKEYCVGGKNISSSINNSKEFSESGKCQAESFEGPTTQGVAGGLLVTIIAAVSVIMV